MAEQVKMCERCGLDEATSGTGKHCRDCDLEWVWAITRCRECGENVMNPEFCGPRDQQHKLECSLKDSDSYQHPSDEAAWAAWDARHQDG